jgi:hypothetical protein
VEAVQVREAENREVYLTFSPRFEHIWLESKNRLLEFAAQKPANIGLRSRYPLRLYDWAKKYASVGTTHITLEHLRTLLGLGSCKGCRRQRYPGSALSTLGELPSASVNFRQYPYE